MFDVAEIKLLWTRLIEFLMQSVLLLHFQIQLRKHLFTNYVVFAFWYQWKLNESAKN